MLLSFVRFSSVATLLLPIVLSGSADAELNAVFRQRVHPVLIRSEHNPFLQLTVTSDEPYAELRAVTIELSGASNLDAVQLFVTGENAEFSAEKSFGDSLQVVGNRCVFHGHFRMNTGHNHFWLSCRLKVNASLSERIDASVVSVETSAGPVIPSDLTTGVSHRIGIALRRHWDDGVHTYRIPVLATTPAGTLLCAYDMRRRARRDLQEDIDIGLLRSSDGGQTWQAQRLIMDMGTFSQMPQEQNGCSDPGLLVDPATGRIFCFAVWTNGRPGTHQWNENGSEPGHEIGKSAQFMMVTSTDDGQTWSKPVNLTRSVKDPSWILYAPAPQQGIALKDGTLVMPTQGRDEKDQRFSNLMISSDHGNSWTVSPPASVGNNECQAVELSDGSIMLNCRSIRPVKFRTVVVTQDLGKSWTPHVTSRKTLIEPNCNGSTYRFEYRSADRSGSVLLFANPHSQTSRSKHTIQVSFDEGLTWPDAYHLLLDVDSGAGYPSLSRVDDSHVGIVYEGSRSQLVFERISVSELLTKQMAE